MSDLIADITRFIFISDEPRRSDVIFAPGGPDPAIPESAAELYLKGFARFVVPSGGVSAKNGAFCGVWNKSEIYDKAYKTECEFYTDALLRNGVPTDAVIGEEMAGYTKENAVLSRKLLDIRGIAVRRAIVCCKAFHARRCFMSYKTAFPEAEILVYPLPVYGITAENWYTTEYGIERVMGELARCGAQFGAEIASIVAEFDNAGLPEGDEER